MFTQHTAPFALILLCHYHHLLTHLFCWHSDRFKKNSKWNRDWAWQHMLCHRRCDYTCCSTKLGEKNFLKKDKLEIAIVVVTSAHRRQVKGLGFTSTPCLTLCIISEVVWLCPAIAIKDRYWQVHKPRARQNNVSGNTTKAPNKQTKPTPSPADQTKYAAYACQTIRFIYN